MVRLSGLPFVPGIYVETLACIWPSMRRVKYVKHGR